MEGRGAFLLADGTVELGRFKGSAEEGEGVRWNPSRTVAHRLNKGQPVEEISLDEGAKIAAALGLPVPPVITPGEGEEGEGEDDGAAPREATVIAYTEAR